MLFSFSGVMKFTVTVVLKTFFFIRIKKNIYGYRILLEGIHGCCEYMGNLLIN